MLIKTRGIVFRVVKYGETSVISDIYTEERGLQTYIIHGVRTKNPKIHAGLLQTMSLIEMVVYAKEGKELHHVKELKSAYPYKSIPFQIIKSAVGSFMLELAQKTLKESESNRELFNFLFDIFAFLDESELSVVNTHLSFMVKLAAYLGIMPESDSNHSNQYFDIKEGVFTSHLPLHLNVMDKQESTVLQKLLSTPISESHHILLNTEERRKFINNMIKYYEFHIPNFKEMKSFTILQIVMS